jgi:hypothetical protein
MGGRRAAGGDRPNHAQGPLGEHLAGRTHFSASAEAEADMGVAGRVYNMEYPMSGGYVWRAV